MKILIVDDNEHMRNEIVVLVSRPGDDLRSCGDGATAIGEYEAMRPDWVLMDVRMPGMDGLAATREILARDPGAKIAVVTNYAEDQELRNAANAAGAKLFLGKDRLDELRDALDAFDRG